MGTQISNIRLSHAKPTRTIVTLTIAWLLSSCASQSAPPSATVMTLSALYPQAQTFNQRPFHTYIDQLARQLFSSTHNINIHQLIAVGSFLPMDDLTGKHLPQESVLGQQIQESFVTLATQAGLNVVEFKTAKTIKLSQNLDVMLSRQVKEINPSINIDYYLTGTYAFQGNGVVVNARLIEVANSHVIAAATDLIPNYVALNLSGTGASSQSRIDHQLYHLK
jgi:TolB-like protein